MYQETMQAIHGSLVQKGIKRGLTHIMELIPSRQSDGQMYAFFVAASKGPLPTVHRAWQLSTKQDHLVCFLGGSLMLGATTTGSNVSPVSRPPLASELTESGQKGWKLGIELINTCMDTYETAT
jgi:endoplasmic reticulum Man9GlcNAc2 1,2-alpha-mannosidase